MSCWDFHNYRQISGEKLDPHEDAVAPEDVDVRFVALWAQIAERFKGEVIQAFVRGSERTERDDDGGPLEPPVRPNRTGNPQEQSRSRAGHRTDRLNSARGLKDFAVPNDPDLIITIHNYEPFHFSHQGANWVTPVMPTGVTCCNPAQLVNWLRRWISPVRGARPITTRSISENSAPMKKAIWIPGSVSPGPCATSRAAGHELGLLGVQCGIWYL